MSKHDDLPNKKELIKLLDHFDQLVEEDEMIKNRLLKLLNRISGRKDSLETLPPQQNTNALNNQEKITYRDKIVYQDKIVEKIIEKRIEVPVEKIVEVVPAWVKSFEPQLGFFEDVKAHPAIKNILLPNQDDVLSLIVTAAQWNNVLRVWDVLAMQIKDTKQPLNDSEQKILVHCLMLFNLTLQDNKATLQHAAVGDVYDYDIHQTISASGDKVSKLLLAGLFNVAGEKVRSTIVETQ